MKRLLCLCCCIATLQGFSQVRGIGTPYTTFYADSFTYVNKLIMQRYCNDVLLHQPGPVLMNLYNPQPDLQFRLDANAGAIYNPAIYGYYFYPINYTQRVESIVQSGFGPIKHDIYNPYGASRPSEAIIFGTINYLLNKPRR